MITIVDYGMGNLGSIASMLKRVGVKVHISGEPDVIANARKILLPGVGAFDAAMERIASTGLREVLDRKALQEQVPVLGICLGMQLLTRGSEEGALPGLGWIPASTRRFPQIPGLKVPHMGWNIALPMCECALTRGLPEEPRFYFVHSYYVAAEQAEDSLMKSTHGVRFDSAIRRGNIFGAQFHPEKSHKFGMQLLQNFAAI